MPVHDARQSWGHWIGLRHLCLVMGLAFVGGCASQAVPDWVRHPYSNPNELCAVGVSGPTYHPEEALEYSKANAFLSLAQQVKTQIRSSLDVVQKEDGGSGSQVMVQDVAAFDTDSIVEMAEVKGVWVSPGGEWGEKGTVQTLVCMPKNRIPSTAS